MDAALSAAYKGGEGIDDVLKILKEIKDKPSDTTGRPFSVKGGVYDPEQGFIQAPWEGGGGTEEPPKSRERKVGDKVITEEWDAKTGTWKNLGESPRWEPPKPTGENGREYSKADLSMINKTLAELPKMKKEANAQETAIKSIDKNLKLIETGQVTGKGGQFKAFIAPYAEMLGVNIKSLSDAQAFQLMSRAIVGPMRLEIVGSGPVSNYEQELMNKISGGGGASRDAAKELLEHWKARAQSKIDDYNNTVTGFTEFYPASGKIYKPIGQSTVKQDPLGIRR
jgi:hypothetical protein